MALSDGNWVPLVDYAVRKRISLSTLRRHIKSNRVLYRLEAGKYWIFDDVDDAKAALELARGAQTLSSPSLDALADPFLAERMNRLEQELRAARQEIADLQMLMALYEEKIPTRVDGF